MTGKQYRSELLGKQHDRRSFTCGIVALDKYFREQAGQDQRRDLAAPYVLIATETRAIAGFYTLSAFSIVPTSLPDALVQRLSRYDALPATMIGRLATDVRYRGQGVGKRLLLDALARCLEASKNVASLAVVVDAKDDAARRFYEHFDFVPVLDKANRLVLPMGTIAQLGLEFGPEALPRRG